MSLRLFKKKKNKVIPIIQENKKECIRLIEVEMFKNIFSETLTDLSYNGKNFFALDNDIGRYKIDIKLTSDEVLTYIKLIANYMLKPFNNKNPYLDVSFGDYRLSAIHPYLARDNNEKVITFSLRKITCYLRIKPNDPLLAPSIVHELIRSLMRSYQSILISGQTGSGKTELQKYLVSLANPLDRIILIEESYETHLKEIFPNMDITSWIVDNQQNQLSLLVKLALRNNPDWLMVAETRGNEATDLISAIKTGHSTITTIHSESAKYSLDRLLDMCKKDNKLDEKMFLSNLAKHLKIGIHLEKIYSEAKGKFIRRISEIVEYVSKEDGYEARTIFEIIKKEDLSEYYVFHYISDDLKNILIKHDIDLVKLKCFIKERK